MSTRPILIVAGEPSGDWLAARLVRALRERAPSLSFFGIGGGELRSEGCECLQDIEGMAVMGLTDVLRRFPFFIRLMRRVLHAADERRPQAAILVDYPGFNLRLAPALSRRGIPIYFYVVPQVWAWHRSRARILNRTGRRILSLFPFEPPLLAELGVHAEYVGHPLADTLRALRTHPPDPLPWPKGEPRLLILPGSRPAEIARHLPLMLEAAVRLEGSFPHLACLVACPTAADASTMANRIATHHGARPSRLEVVGGQTRSALLQATAAVVASGTVTLEAALARCPMVIGYRLSPLSYWAAKRVVDTPHIGLVNLIAGRRLCPELVQHQCQAETLANALRPLLEASPERAAMVAGLEEVIRRMEGPNAAEQAAGRILDDLRQLGR